LKQVQAHPENLAILERAADFMLLFDRGIAEEFLKKAQAKEPDNARWSERLAHLYSLSANSGNGVDLGIAGKALAEMERAQATAKGDPFRHLEQLAKMAFAAGEIDKARAYAKALLEQAPPHSGPWTHGNAVHFGHIVLGQIAVRDGNLDAAKAHLLAAGRTPGSPQLNSFGPSMALASELLQKGERDTVLDYFKLCREFWKNGGSRLDAMTDAVVAGNSPDFGPNLRR
jgi:hypothetical protein